MTTLVVGAIAASRIPVELIPRGFEDPFLSVRVPWDDAPSQEVLDKVILPLEEEMSTVRGIKNMFTLSRTGFGFVWLPFKHGTDMDVAYREVRDRVERAKARFPSDIDRAYVQKHDPSGFPVYVMGVAIDESAADHYNLIHDNIVMRLERVDGVASVEVDGLLEKEILIEIDREKAASAGLNLFELAQTLNGDNFTLSSGNVRDGSRKLMLRSMAKYSSLEELQNRLVSESVRLGDVARISYEQPEKDFRVRAMSKPAVAVVVLKEGDANIRDVSMAVKETVEGFKDDPRLSQLETVTLFSQGDVIDESLSTLLNSGMIGGMLAGVVLMFFLRRFRLTLILALSIPLSMVIGLTAMYFFGETLNLLTLLGLMICVGLLVDNSVVVAENIHRLHRAGMERRDACIHGAGEVGLAITMSTLTTIVVFLPVALADGPGQFFMLRLALPVCVSVAGSLLVALVFIPLAVYLTLSENAEEDKTSTPVRRVHGRLTGFLRWGYDTTFGRINRAYNRLLSFFVVRRVELVLAIIGVFVITAATAMKEVTFVEVQQEERGGFGFEIELAQNTTLEEAEEWFLEAEKVVEAKQEELGLEGWFLFHRKTHGELQGWFTTPRSSDVSPSEATEAVRNALPKKAGLKLIVMGDQEAGEEKEDKSIHTVIINGEDAELLDDIKESLEDVFVRVDGVLGLKGRNEPLPSELALVVDRDRTQHYGVNPQVVAGVVGLALRGTALPKFYRDGKEIPVRIRFQEEDRESLTELADFMVPTNDGEFLPVSALTDTKFIDPPGSIFRRNKRMARAITLELEEGKEEETRTRLALLTAGIDLPEGLSFGEGGSRQAFNEDLKVMRNALILSIVFIFLLMGFLFESFSLPFSIILTIPLSILGVYWIHFVMGFDIDFLGVVAMVLLVGVVVNNGIVLIDYVNRLREQGQSRRDAVLTATDRRFRPIMMTAITTIGGLIPLAFAGANSIGLSYTSFALTLIGGMTTATLLTLLVVPVFYSLFDDLREALQAVWRRVLVGVIGEEHGVQPELPAVEPDAIDAT
ncbi:MAG: efflux RND transporter permease subunit [bacterium]|nr:efflux RND transporter permease subunit [bacterium]